MPKAIRPPADFNTRLRLEREAIHNAKPGDTFYRKHYGNMLGAVPVIVERTTKTQIVLSNGDRLKRETGDLVGAGNRVSYMPNLPHVVAEIEEARNAQGATLAFHNVEDRIKAIRSGGVRRHNSAKLMKLAQAITAALDAFEAE